VVHIKAESIAATVTAMAALIAKDKSADELNVIGCIFTQLGDTLATISAIREVEESQQESKNNSTESGQNSKKT
jgi:hypothetical protein